MRAFNSVELARMQANTIQSFQDICTIDTLSVTRNPLGEELKTYTSSSDIVCGFEMVGGDEQSKNQLIITQTKAIVKLPVTQNPTIKDRITIKKINGVSITPIQFEITSEAIRAVDSIRIDLIKVGV
jgi:hypothetical protein